MTRIHRQPFHFTEDQIEYMLHVAWKQKDPEPARNYLKAIESRIGYWQAFKAVPQDPSHGEIKAKMGELYKKLSDVQQFIEKIPKYIRIVTEISTAPPETIRRALGQINESTALLMDAAQDVAKTIPVSTGPDIHLEVWLVGMLASLWWRAFNEKPAPRGRFEVFIKELSGILGYDIGAAAIKRGVDTRVAHFIPPAP